MPSATDCPAATSGARHHARPRGLTTPRRLGLAALLSVIVLALAGPADAATRSAGPSPDPSPSSPGSASPSPDPVPQATGAGSVVSSESATSQGSTSHGSGTSGSGIVVQVPYTVPVAPQVSHSSTTTPDRTSTAAGTDGTAATTRSSAGTSAHRPAHTTKPQIHRTARQTAAQREAALAYQQLRNGLALESRTAAPIAAAATLTSAPAHRDGILLLIGAGVLFFLAASSGALLRKLWRLHGQWYGGRPA